MFFHSRFEYAAKRTAALRDCPQWRRTPRAAQRARSRVRVAGAVQRPALNLIVALSRESAPRIPDTRGRGSRGKDGANQERRWRISTFHRNPYRPCGRRARLWRFPYSRFRPRTAFATRHAMLKQAIADTDIYSLPEEVQLDKRVLTEALGVSRTPVREAMTLLEQEGFLRTVPRKGIFIVRKTKAEIVE